MANKFICDFGISQEDYRTEMEILDLRAGDRLLCVASAGEVPLNILATTEGIKITAVDVSVEQLYLCKLKLLVATEIEFPLNGRFLGYGRMEEKHRMEMYRSHIRALLSEEEKKFWDIREYAVRKGVVNSGRFEKYIRRLQLPAGILIGKKNLERLLSSNNTGEQQQVFDQNIAARKRVRFLFKAAFHPAIYKKRGLSEQALRHAEENTGSKYFKHFRNFCTATPSRTNYFLQYFLFGHCRTTDSYPEYLKEGSRLALENNKGMISFDKASITEALLNEKEETFNKVHLSNIGDWMSKEEFDTMMVLAVERLQKGSVCCYRFLHKNHFERATSERITIQERRDVQQRDRFPFYSTLSIHI